MISLIEHSRRADITFHRSGRIDIAARVARMLSLGEGDVVDIAEHFSELYVYVSRRADGIVGRYEATCRPTKRRSHNFRAHSVRLCRAMFARGGCRHCSAMSVPVGVPIEIAGYGVCIPVIILNNISFL